MKAFDALVRISAVIKGIINEVILISARFLEFDQAINWSLKQCYSAVPTPIIRDSIRYAKKAYTTMPDR